MVISVFHRTLNSRRCAGLYRLWEVPVDGLVYQRPCVGMKPEISKKKSRTFPTVVPRRCFTACAACAGAGWRGHGDHDPEHLVLTAALRVEAGQLSGGSHVIGRETDSTGMSVKVGGRHHFSVCSQVVFLAIGIGCPVWGIFCDKYGRRTVSDTPVLFHVLLLFLSCWF